MKHHGLLLAFLVASTSSLSAQEPAVDYLRDVKPIFQKHCVGCHGPAKQKSGLRLDTAAHMLQGGSEGSVVAVGKSKDSRLLHVLTGVKDAPAMPPEGKVKLSAIEVAVIRNWIDQGAKAPAKEDVVASSAKSDHWAFQSPKRSPLPAVTNEAWVRSPIDRFILAKLDKEKLAPSREADRVTLLRRVSLDLTGLPPTLAEIDAFLADLEPGAYERVVDRLLASPHYGERWARHWLDQARYADSNGFNIDAPRTMWPYRDWVIHALNRDLPFNQFAVQQIAGDLLPKATRDMKIATGFHRNTLINQEGGIDLEQFRVESVVDRVNTTGAVFLGLTLGCAQCHDHKYDPVSQKEFYQLFAFFNQCDEPTLQLPTPEQAKQQATYKTQLARITAGLKGLDTTSEAKQEKWEEQLSNEHRLKLSAAIKTIVDKPGYQRTTKEKQKLSQFHRDLDQIPQIVAHLGDPLLTVAAPSLLAVHLHQATLRGVLEKQLAALKKQEPKIPTTLVLQERVSPRETTIHIRGDFTRKGKKVQADTPAALHALPTKATAPNRLDFAQWLVHADNPLTARVTMNRLWQQYFGLGLVETDNDFGTQGTPPSHPELLDWLATEFIAQKWSLKAMHKAIVTSATYRQDSKARADLNTTDPRNRLLGRQNRLRLEAETVRDVALASSGLLSRVIGGPSVFPPQPDGVFAFTQVQRDWKPDTGADRYRRGMYTHFWRSAPHPALMAFDAPDSTQSCTRRNRSNTPLQALTLLNDRAFVEFAQALAARVLKEAPDSDAARLKHAFRLCLARDPSDRETQRLSDLLSQLQRDLAADPEESKRLAATPREAAWMLACRVLLNLDEFITRE